MTTATPPHTTTIRVLLFARYAELLGGARLELDLPFPATVGAAIAALRSRPGGESLPARLFVARNLEQVTEDVALEAGDEVALLPPLSGG
jgi:molybdopterin converting factor small subunit